MIPKKIEIILPKVGMAENSAFYSRYGAVGVISESCCIVLIRYNTNCETERDKIVRLSVVNYVIVRLVIR